MVARVTAVGHFAARADTIGMNVKQDTRAFLDICERLLATGCHVRFRAHGVSMLPSIRDGEAVTLEDVEPSAVQPGDILLYRHGERPFAHRVVRVHHDGHAVVGFVLRGDAKAGCDAPVKPEQILGRVLPQMTMRRRLRRYFRSRRPIGRHQSLAPRTTRQA